uniref:Beta/gamma crystallin 'Greek key' domain-containing protein n=1 Tax=Oncorhynchus mykiss TaxID=8022 RepID=A0A8L0DUJ4_ONCMY
MKREMRTLIIFYEDKNFQGRSYEASNDCPELTSHLSRCNSCRVESGCFMVYERPNFMGHQMLVRRGEYPDNQRLMGMSQSDCIRSSRLIPMVRRANVSWFNSVCCLFHLPHMDKKFQSNSPKQHKGNFMMRIYEKENFGGQMHEMMDDCDSIQERYRMSDCQSCNVMDGHWLMYEQPHFRGRMIYLRPGEYRSLRDMGLGPVDMRIGSIRRIMDSC